MKLKVTIIRHGEANYSQGKVLLGEAKDLTLVGVQEVTIAAEKLAATIDTDAQVRMWSSPYSRTLQTATIVFDVLAAHNQAFALKNAAGEVCAQNVIRILHRFDEVRNFDLQLFLTFLNGGEVKGFGDAVITLEKATTNPEGLSFAEYFNSRAWENLTGVPPQLLAAMHAIEYRDDTQRRLNKVLDRLARLSLAQSQKTHIVLVSHQGVMEGLSKEAVKPADFFTIHL